MSRHSSREHAAENAEVLEVIREEQCSPAISSFNIDEVVSKIATEEVTPIPPCTDCQCLQEMEMKNQIDSAEIEKIIMERERVLRNEFQQLLDKETTDLKEKFDFILHNEQIRASYMLREAHRERQEKITALQTQLECKNLAGLMYVMCTERRNTKLLKLRLIEEYSGYIHALQQILMEGQELILNLSRGYKTAARVDHEWREKMKKIVKEFQSYVYHFNGGPPETNQYIFDLPQLLKTEAPIQDNLKEDPIENYEEEQEEEEIIEDPEYEKPWYKLIEGDCRPFVMFGDMAEFKPPQRRDVLKSVKAAKTAPLKWKEYVFNEMFVRANCSNADVIKDEYPIHMHSPLKWECHGVQTDWPSKTSIISHEPRDRMTATSVDVRGNMGSILKIITSNVGQPTNKANLLGARDSMEIASSTKLREKHTKHSDASKVKINVGNRAASIMDQLNIEREEMEEEERIFKSETRRDSQNEEDEESVSMLGSIHNDSLQVIPTHKAEKDHKINYEKVCPMAKCQRMHMDSFVRTLPPYMRANPFTHFEQTYENYEVCSPDQLEILKQRIEEKKKRAQDDPHEESPLAEWNPEVDGVGVQTSEMSFLPPCTCMVPTPTPVSSTGKIFNMADLYPIKQTLDEIRRDCFYEGGIEFDRFKVIGQESKNSLPTAPKEDFKQTRLYEIKKILKQHPSLCEIFQANTRC